MLERVRRFMNSKPWLGWVFAALMLVVSLLLYNRLSGRGETYSVDRMSEVLTIKCAETGEEWTMSRGMMEKELRNRGASLDPSEGLTNPKTGKRTGFPFSKSSWEETVERINREKKEVTDNGGAKPRSRK